ncbi:undecaprenyldiphospho-muramoylpentapeptide beta-N-acetylglucosaminyltransferase [Camelliibacillus cellulosilyticus]|uniref:UDP-N-acetylglucosamine--N-acetylmuramyl-(pentapeptide) pyrophosphoryl-undecaprenol N-acetylglucosamine transferase n=1 Tax=Camelliibacillus cellulosilyticus TaxID=2174486 RepID=A0ABV9GK97_9BACL
MEKHIILTGGGSAGHVTVNLALIPELIKEGWTIDYIGSHNGIEKELLSDVKDVRYHAISTGKLRRYFDWNNFKDPFKVLKGTFQAYRILKKQKAQVVFSKGGFVSVPVILASRLRKVPSIIHESDLTPGLANKIAAPFATKVCVTFPETSKHIKGDKAVHVGAVIRENLFKGSAEKGFKICDLRRGKPVILIMGGSLGAKAINQAVRANLDRLLQDFQIIHLCGKGNVDHELKKPGYKQFEYVKEELPDLFAITDLIVSRAGSNAIFECLALKKPMLLIPLPKSASRGDQIDNAKSFQKAGFAEVVMEENLEQAFLPTLEKLYNERDHYIGTMKTQGGSDGLVKIMNMIESIKKVKR